MNNKKRNEKILNLTCELLAKMNFEVEKAFVEDMEEEENQVLVGIVVKNPASLIGFRGRNLVSIQFVLSLMVRTQIDEGVRVLLDVNNYRNEQKDRLKGMVANLIEKVIKTGNPVSLANMSSYERRLCHMMVAENEQVMSESEGEGEERHVVIKLKA
jgi:spoIIIJ-associated protein